MNLDAIPIGIYLAVATLAVMLAIEVGYRLGNASLKRPGEEKEAPVSAVAATVLGLVAFMLAFTFGIVADRYTARKALVREEAGQIRTAWQRSVFLAEPDRTEAAGLLKRYVDLRLEVAGARDFDQLRRLVAESSAIQGRLWEMAVVNARKDMNSDIGALFIESLNELARLQAERVAIGSQTRIPAGLWLALWLLVLLGMVSMGYQTAVAGSRRSWAQLLLAVSFSLVIALIVSLDRPQGRFIPVSQQSMVDLRAAMATDGGAGTAGATP